MIFTYIILQIALTLLGVVGYLQVSGFLKQHGGIYDHAQMEAFKDLVRINMYVALVYLVVAIPTFLLSIYISWNEGLYGLGIVLATGLPQILLGKKLKSLEQEAKQLRCSDQFAGEYRFLTETWHKKALPNF